MIKEFDFYERMSMSQGVSANAKISEILMGNVPGATAARLASPKDDRNGTDWWLDHTSGKSISVDCKVRESDWLATHPDEDDLALETHSVIEANKVGWTRDPQKRTDYILWLWRDTGRWCLLPFPMLCGVFMDSWKRWSNEFRIARQVTVAPSGSYHSECVFVPRRTVWRAIYLKYGG